MKSCKFCKKSFPQQRNLTRHMRSVHGHVLWKCPRCGQECGRADQLRRHLYDHGVTAPGLLPGDQYAPSKVIMATGNTGEIIPWSTTHNLLLVTPMTVCGVVVPRAWDQKLACAMLRIPPASLREARSREAPTTMKLHQEMQQVVALEQDTSSGKSDEEEVIIVSDDEE